MTKTMTKILAIAAMISAAATNSSAQNQNNLGADCGCPPVNLRPLVDLSTLATAGVLTATNTVLTCNNNYLIKEKIYVPDGKSITINPGTVVLGRDLNAPGAGVASALVIERGGQIIAAGTPTCQIVFTAAADILTAAPDNGADNILGNYQTASGAPNGGKWGGVVICGKATNNYKNAADATTLGLPANNDSGLQIAGQVSGTAAVEGISNAEADIRTWFGGTDDNDNSGIMRYCSIRHAGDIIVAGNELNSLTLASVGRGTTIDHIEVVCGADDAIEVFGGTVNLKYCSFLFGDDDGLDYDVNWRGSAQFIFSLTRQGTGETITDHGIEADGDDGSTNVLQRSHPKIYNATFIGSNQSILTTDNTGDAGAMFKERSEGELYNCIFANYNRGIIIDKVKTSRAGGPNNEAYHNWQTGFSTSGTLLIGCNTFVNCANPLVIEDNSAYSVSLATAGDLAKFAADGNVSVSSLTGFDYAYTMNYTTNVVTDKFDAVPEPLIASTCATPVDGFFTSAAYRGAFEAGKKSWLSEWAILNVLAATTGIVNCPTDVNGDGTTNNADFLQLLGQFNQSCN